MNDSTLVLLVKLHDDLRANIKAEIDLLRLEVHKWRDEAAETKKFTWKLSGGIAMLVLMLEGVIKAAEVYVSSH